MVIGENCCIFIVLIYKSLQTIIAVITENNVIELFYMADDFCNSIYISNYLYLFSNILSKIGIYFRGVNGLFEKA